MKPSDYEFAIGDKVVTIYGEVGHVVDICRCDCAFTAKASECREDFMHCVTHECLECRSKLRAFGLPNRFRERD